jgi:hypothetical protein
MQLLMPRRRLVAALSLTLVAATLSSCADGPFNGGGRLNPWLRKEWDKDERRGPTFHTKMEQLRDLAANASQFPPDRQEALAREMLERYQNEANPLLRAAVVKVAGNLRGSAVAETLKAAMHDADPEIRIAAAKALGSRGGEDALELLASAIASDADLDVRIAAAAELKRFRNSPDATRALALALDDNDAALQHQAIKSLEQVTGHSYGMSVPAWREYLAGGSPTPPPGPTLAERWKGWVWW